MRMPAASIADISDVESRSAKFKLLFCVWLGRKKYEHLSAYATNYSFLNILTQFGVLRYGVSSELPVF